MSYRARGIGGVTTQPIPHDDIWPSGQETRYALLREARLTNDPWVKRVNGQRRYTYDVDPGHAAVEVEARAGTFSEHFIITHAALRLVSGPTRVEAEYDDPTGLVPARARMVCDGCGHVGKIRAWTARREMNVDAARHECPQRRRSR